MGPIEVVRRRPVHLVVALLVATIGTFILLWTLAPISSHAFLGAGAGLQGAVYFLMYRHAIQSIEIEDRKGVR